MQWAPILFLFLVYISQAREYNVDESYGKEWLSLFLNRHYDEIVKGMITQLNIIQSHTPPTRAEIDVFFFHFMFFMTEPRFLPSLPAIQSLLPYNPFIGELASQSIINNTDAQLRVLATEWRHQTDRLGLKTLEKSPIPKMMILHNRWNHHVSLSPEAYTRFFPDLAAVWQLIYAQSDTQPIQVAVPISP